MNFFQGRFFILFKRRNAPQLPSSPFYLLWVAKKVFLQFTVAKTAVFAYYKSRAMTNNLQHIPIDQIRPSRTPLRPVRKDEVEFLELIDSIRADGILQPILVRPDKLAEPSPLPLYEVVEGGHRYEAAKFAGVETIPCFIRDLTDNEVLIIQLKVQAVRPKDVCRWEYARRLEKLIKDGYTIADLAKLIDKNPPWIKDTLSLKKLIPEAINKLNDGSMAVRAAKSLSLLPAHLQTAFLEDACMMEPKAFKARCLEAKRNYDAFLLQEREEEHEYGKYLHIRPYSIIMQECIDFANAPDVLTICQCKTPADGWKACLAWVMSIDPVTIKNRKEGRKREKRKVMTEYEIRKHQRKMIETLSFEHLENLDE